MDQQQAPSVPNPEALKEDGMGCHSGAETMLAAAAAAGKSETLQQYDADYPRGFSTTWPKREMQGVNEYAKFKELEGKEKTGALSARDRSPVN